MIAYCDKTEDIKEKSEVRFQVRAKPSVKELIKKASRVFGTSESSFMVNAAYEAAQKVIFEHERTLLEKVDHESFFDALDRDIEPTKDMISAFKQYESTTVSR